MEIGSNLKELRKKANLTQAELAKKLYLTPQAISKWEHDKSYPDLPTIIKLSNLYKVSTDEILGISKESFLNSLFSKKKGGFNMFKLIRNVINIALPNMFRFSFTTDFDVKNYPELKQLGLWKPIDSRTSDLIINQWAISDDLTEIVDIFKIVTNKKDSDFSVKRTYQVFSF